jgi:hypothetical protein
MKSKRPQNKGVTDLAVKSGYSQPFVSQMLSRGKTPEEILAMGEQRRGKDAERESARVKGSANPDEEESFSGAQRRKEIATANLKELELAQKNKELLPMQEVQSAWVTVAAAVKAAVRRIPDKLAPAVANAGDATKVRSIMTIECETILRKLSADLEPANL